MRQWEYLKFMIGGTFCFLEFRLDFFKWLPQKSKHIQILLQANRSSKSICKPFFGVLGFFCKDINQHWGSLQRATRFPVMLWGDAVEKEAGLSSRRRNHLCLRTAKICIQKAVTWVAFSQNLECKRILQFFNKTGEEWCHGRGFPGVWCLWMINM